MFCSYGVSVLKTTNQTNTVQLLVFNMMKIISFNIVNMVSANTMETNWMRDGELLDARSNTFLNTVEGYRKPGAIVHDARWSLSPSY